MVGRLPVCHVESKRIRVPLLRSGLPVRLRFRLSVRGFVLYVYGYVDVIIKSMNGPEGDIMCMGPMAK